MELRLSIKISFSKIPVHVNPHSAHIKTMCIFRRCLHEIIKLIHSLGKEKFRHKHRDEQNSWSNLSQNITQGFKCLYNINQSKPIYRGQFSMKFSSLHEFASLVLSSLFPLSCVSFGFYSVLTLLKLQEATLLVV